MIALLAVVYSSVQSARKHAGREATSADRAAAARSILGARSIPDGYHPIAAMTLSGLMEAVVLTDIPSATEHSIDRFENRLFIYLETGISSPTDREAEIEPLLDVWPGRLTLEPVETASGDWEISRGSLFFPTYQATYRSGRGTASMGPGKLEGAFMLVALECPDDDRRRTALWFEKRSGSPEALRRFLGNLEPCGQ
jgi:hypothetical protein